MNEQTELLTRKYTPEVALIVYKAPSRALDSEKEHFYIESHSINDAGQLMEGKPLLHETIAGIVDVFRKQHKELSKLSGYIPENLLKYETQSGGHYQMVWYRPAEERVIHFSSSLALPSGKAIVPAMLYMATKKDLYVFALKTNKRPELNTGLLKAPFQNVYAEGKVCLGSAKVKKPVEKTFMAAMKYWEDMFWLSEFTGINGAGNDVNKNLPAIWKKAVKGKGPVKWCDINPLKAHKNLTLKSIL